MAKQGYEKITWEDFDNNTFEDKLCETAKINLYGNACDYEYEMKFSLVDTESPIEQVMAIELARYNLIDNFDLFNEYVEVLGIENQKDVECEGKKYRADFLISVHYDLGDTQYDKNFVIECDGHDFHEKTKKQVSERNTRDRILSRNGYVVLHFSGSEIMKSASKCVKEIIESILKGLDDYGNL